MSKKQKKLTPQDKTKIKKDKILAPLPNARKRIYGCKPDLIDGRDVKYSTIFPVKKVYPDKIDLRSTCPPIVDQLALGSCTSNAFVGTLGYLMIKDKVKFAPMSRLFLYYNERVIENSVMSDAGAMLRDGIKTLVRQGICTETSWPYDITKFANKPTKSCYVEALTHQVLSYTRIITLDDMLSCLSSGFPFVCGISVYESFESDVVAKTGVVPMPSQNEALLGGHAVVCVGYDNTNKIFMMRNSWGTGWGMQGYFTIPFDYMLRYSNDMWSIRRGELM
jgi:C1A family cysteine protease